MRSKFTALAVTATALAAACANERVASPRETPQFAVVAAAGNSATGRHLVSFSGSVPATFESVVASLGGRVVWSQTDAGMAAVSGLTSTAASQLAAMKGIQDVAADEAFQLDDPVPDAGSAEPVDELASQANPAGAARFARQWNMLAVQANTAWSAGNLGSSSVKVYVLDTGIDYLNLDLNGLVDGSLSRDMLGTFNVTVNNVSVPFTEADTVAKYFPTRAAYTDLYFHGTHVAATVSSLAIAAAGVTSHTTLVAVKVCAYLNTCPFSAIIGGILYAAANGADVINMSLGGGFGKAGNGRYVGFINKTFNYAKNHGTTIVVAAGNAAADMDHDGNTYVTYCATPAVICVSATGPTAQASVNGPWTDIDAPAYYTNYGRSAVDVAAPGGNNNSFVYAGCSRTSLIVPVCQTGNFIIGAQGTSMASPHVAGTAAMLVQTLGRSPSQIKARIVQTSDDLGQPGNDPFYGMGRLNVARAVGAIP